MSKTFEMISLICFCTCGAFTLISVFIWFKLKIHKVINDLSGRTEKMEIERLKSIRAKSAINTAEHLLKSSSDNISSNETGVKSKDASADTSDSSSTTLLESGDTQLLESEDTQMLDTMETSIMDDENITEQLDDTQSIDTDTMIMEEEMPDCAKAINFTITESIDLHSSDIDIYEVK